MLFSEPKIPQSDRERRFHSDTHSFSALQRAENSSIAGSRSSTAIRWRFSALQRAENSSMFAVRAVVAAIGEVSVLFSEPKIPQCVLLRLSSVGTRRFSALQRAENSSICNKHRCLLTRTQRFSALQRAENSSIYTRDKLPELVAKLFQCSSASRKFLNMNEPTSPEAYRDRFSALQRAENSSIGHAGLAPDAELLFQCSSASRKFLNSPRPGWDVLARGFQCSSASRKFLKFWRSWVSEYA